MCRPEDIGTYSCMMLSALHTYIHHPYAEEAFHDKRQVSTRRSYLFGRCHLIAPAVVVDRSSMDCSKEGQVPLRYWCRAHRPEDLVRDPLRNRDMGHSCIRMEVVMAGKDRRCTCQRYHASLHCYTHPKLQSLANWGSRIFRDCRQEPLGLASLDLPCAPCTRQRTRTCNKLHHPQRWLTNYATHQLCNYLQRSSCTDKFLHSRKLFALSCCKLAAKLMC